MSALVTNLKALRELLTPPDRWTRGEYARNASGVRTMPTAKDAQCFCLSGAMSRVALRDGTLVANAYYLALRDALADSLPNKDPISRNNPLVAFNDIASHEEVLALIDKTITKVEANG